jgi:hypothetical protein
MVEARALTPPCRYREAVKAIVVPERLFTDIFSRAEYELNQAIHVADDLADASQPTRLAVALANVQSALHRLRDRLVEAQL